MPVTEGEAVRRTVIQSLLCKTFICSLRVLHVIQSHSPCASTLLDKDTRNSMVTTHPHVDSSHKCTQLTKPAVISNLKPSSLYPVNSCNGSRISTCNAK